MESLGALLILMGLVGYFIVSQVLPTLMLPFAGMVDTRKAGGVMFGSGLALIVLPHFLAG